MMLDLIGLVLAVALGWFARAAQREPAPTVPPVEIAPTLGPRPVPPPPAPKVSIVYMDEHESICHAEDRIDARLRRPILKRAITPTQYAIYGAARLDDKGRWIYRYMGTENR